MSETPSTIQITRLLVAPAADRRRVRLHVEFAGAHDPSPFLELMILDPDGRCVAEMLVMGVQENPLELTLHLRPPAPDTESRPYQVVGRLFVGVEEQPEQTLSQTDGQFHFPPAAPLE